MEIDKKNRKLLHLLDYDGRATTTYLAKKTRLSKQNISYRLNKLIESGIIKKFVAVIDAHKIGLISFRVYIRIRYDNPEYEGQVIEEFVKHQNVLWFVSLTGPWDFEAVILAKNYLQFYQVFREIQERLPHQLSKTNLSVTIVNNHYPKDYLVNAQRNPRPSASYGNLPRNISLDPIEENLLRELSRDCRRSLRQLSKEIGVSHPTVKKHMNELEERGIIQSYRAQIAVQKLGYSHQKIALYLPTATENKIEKCMNFCSQFPNITYIVRCVGDWEVELEMEVKNLSEVEEVITKVRAKFPTEVTDYFTFQVREELKLNYFSI